MRSFCLLLLLGTLIAAPLAVSPGQADTPSTAHESSLKTGESGEYALLVRTFRHVKGAVITAEQMGGPNSYDDYRIVVIGKAAAALAEEEAAGEWARRAEEAGATIEVCGIAMERLGVTESDLPDGVTVVPNGFLRMFELQERGFNTISL